MWKFKNWAWNTIRIPSRAVGTGGLFLADAVRTGTWVIQDSAAVITNTTNKIVELFDKNLKRYQKALNIPVAAWVWLAWAVETAVKAVTNWATNTLKSVVNLATNAYKSTIWSLFTTKPVSDTTFNTLKRKWSTKHLDTRKRVLDTKDLWVENRWFLTGEKKKKRLEKKRAKIDRLIASL